MIDSETTRGGTAFCLSGCGYFVAREGELCDRCRVPGAEKFYAEYWPQPLAVQPERKTMESKDMQ